jgi:hypothetical protein
MAAVAHDPKFAKRVGIPQSVGKEFNRADTGTGILSGPRPKRSRKRIRARNVLGR